MSGVTELRVPMCFQCATMPTESRGVAAAVVEGPKPVANGPVRGKCAVCGSPTIELRTQDQEVLVSWLRAAFDHGVRLSTERRAAVAGAAQAAVVTRMKGIVAALREAGFEPDVRSAADLTRLVWDVEDSLLAEAEKAAKRRRS